LLAAPPILAMRAGQRPNFSSEFVTRSYSHLVEPLLCLMPSRARRLASSFSMLNGTLQKGNSRISVMSRVLRSTTNGNSAQTAGRSA